MSLKELFDAIPYVLHHQVEILAVDEGEVRLRMPFREELKNYVGTVHAGALYTAAETAAGAAAFGLFPDGGAIALLRGARVRYTRRAEGDVEVTARVGKNQAQDTLKTFEETGKGDLAVEVQLTDPQGEVVFEGDFDYAFRRR